MNIEDLIYELHIRCKLNRYDSVLVSSFVNQIFSGVGYTEKQSALTIKILKRYSVSLSQSLGKDITTFLDNPTFKFSIRKLNSTKRISIADHPQWIRVIKVEFPFDEEKVTTIRNNKNRLLFAQWNSDEKSWLFNLDEQNIQFLTPFSKKYNFETDEEFDNYSEQVTKIVKNMENYIPMLTIENNEPKYKNISQFVPKMTSKDIISAIFEARKAGIFTWDENISKYINDIDLDPTTKLFLSNDNSEYLEIDSEEHAIQCLTNIVTHTQPILFIVPGGSEVAKTKVVYNFLCSLGHTSDEMSVMFRLPSNSGREFNEFVKNCELNNPLTEKTKFVFVSIKLPKPIIKSQMKFNSIISLGRSNVHYTIRDYFKNKQNLIYYCETSKQKEFNFAIM